MIKNNTMNSKLTTQAYALAKERYAAIGIDTEEVLEQLRNFHLSMHCWQADDVKGFEVQAGALSGGIQSTGNYPGAARNIDELRSDIFKALPATFLVTFGGFLTNAAYCLFQNARNKTFKDYANGSVWASNLLFCALAGLLWYSQFFGLSLGKGFLTSSESLMTFSWCILMALNVTFSNVWGIILKEWKGCSGKTVAVLITGIIVLIISSFLPELI